MRNKMIDNKFNFCPNCASKKIQYLDGKKWFCPDCGFDLYNNVASAVGVIIYDYEYNVLFEVRAKNPRKGFLALPGGFCNYDESAEDAVKRECKEETGFAPTEISYLCSSPNDYEYKNIAYKTCDLFFTTFLPKEKGTIDNLIKNLCGQQTEVTGFKSCKITSEKDIENIPLAFKSANNALKIWLKSCKLAQKH